MKEKIESVIKNGFEFILIIDQDYSEFYKVLKQKSLSVRAAVLK